MKRKSRLRLLASCAALVAAGAQAAFFLACSYGTSGIGLPVAPPVGTVTISVSPATIILGQSATLSWSTSGVATCIASGAWRGPPSPTGTLTVTPDTTGTFSYTLSCSTAVGSVAQSATLTVNPRAALKIAPRSVPAGESAMLTWSSSGAATCFATDAWSGTRATGGMATTAPSNPGSYVFGLTCADAVGHRSHVAADLTVTNAGFSLTNLVADIESTPALNTDPRLADPWGLVLPEKLPAVVASRHSNTSISYDGTGTLQPSPVPLVVHLPSGEGRPAFEVTAIVANSSNDFVVSAAGRSGAAQLLFAGASGMIAGWSPAVDAANAIVAYIDDGGAVYTGLALSPASDGSVSYLYATDFHNARVEVFDSTFSKQSPSSTRFGFVDPTLPSGYAPFGIAVIGDNVYITYARQRTSSKRDPVNGEGLGLVDVFSLTGDFVKRLITIGGALNAPWAMAQAPALNHDPLGGTLLVGNSGDGKINAFDPSNGILVGSVNDANGVALVVPNLHGLAFGNRYAKQPRTTLFFTAGAHDGANGWYGRIDFGAAPQFDASLAPRIGSYVNASAIDADGRKVYISDPSLVVGNDD